MSCRHSHRHTCCLCGVEFCVACKGHRCAGGGKATCKHARNHFCIICKQPFCVRCKHATASTAPLHTAAAASAATPALGSAAAGSSEPSSLDGQIISVDDERFGRRTMKCKIKLLLPARGRVRRRTFGWVFVPNGGNDIKPLHDLVKGVHFPSGASKLPDITPDDDATNEREGVWVSTCLGLEGNEALARHLSDSCSDTGSSSGEADRSSVAAAAVDTGTAEEAGDFRRYVASAEDKLAAKKAEVAGTRKRIADMQNRPSAALEARVAEARENRNLAAQVYELARLDYRHKRLLAELSSEHRDVISRKIALLRQTQAVSSVEQEYRLPATAAAAQTTETSIEHQIRIAQTAEQVAQKDVERHEEAAAAVRRAIPTERAKIRPAQKILDRLKARHHHRQHDREAVGEGVCPVLQIVMQRDPGSSLRASALSRVTGEFADKVKAAAVAILHGIVRLLVQNPLVLFHPKNGCMLRTFTTLYLWSGQELVSPEQLRQAMEPGPACLWYQGMGQIDASSPEGPKAMQAAMAAVAVGSVGRTRDVHMQAAIRAATVASSPEDADAGTVAAWDEILAVSDRIVDAAVPNGHSDSSLRRFFAGCLADSLLSRKTGPRDGWSRQILSMPTFDDLLAALKFVADGKNSVVPWASEVVRQRNLRTFPPAQHDKALRLSQEIPWGLFGGHRFTASVQERHGLLGALLWGLLQDSTITLMQRWYQMAGDAITEATADIAWMLAALPPPPMYVRGGAGEWLMLPFGEATGPEGWMGEEEGEEDWRWWAYKETARAPAASVTEGTKAVVALLSAAAVTNLAASAQMHSSPKYSGGLTDLTPDAVYVFVGRVPALPPDRGQALSLVWKNAAPTSAVYVGKASNGVRSRWTGSSSHVGMARRVCKEVFVGGGGALQSARAGPTSPMDTYLGLVWVQSLLAALDKQPAAAGERLPPEVVSDATRIYRGHTCVIVADALGGEGTPLSDMETAYIEKCKSYEAFNGLNVRM